MKTTKKRSKALVRHKKGELKKVLEYLVSGGAYFWSGYVAFFVFYRSLHWSLWWAKITADVVGWVVNYSLQRYWVFNNSSLAKDELSVTGRYIFITVVDFLIDYLIVWYLKSIGLTPYLGQFVSAGFFTFWNYFWYKLWVFPEKYNKRRKPA